MEKKGERKTNISFTVVDMEYFAIYLNVLIPNGALSYFPMFVMEN